MRLLRSYLINLILSLQNRFVLSSIILLVGSTISFAQKPEIETSFLNYNVEDGLPSDETYHVIQDSKGFIWIATDQGVARFDGKKFDVFSTGNGLPDDVIFQIYEDRKGRIWFSSFNCKLSYFENNKIHEFQYNDELLKVLDRSPISVKLEVDEEDNVWVGYSNAGLYKIDKKGHVEEVIHDTSDSYYSSRVKVILKENFFSYGRKRNWNSTPSTIRSQIQIEHWDWKRNVDIYWENQVILRAEIAEEQIVISTGHKRVVALSENSHFDTILSSRIISLEYIKNSLWVGMASGGVVELFLDSNSFTMGRHWLEHYSISSIKQDRTGGIWLTTLENGIYYCPDPSMNTLTQGLSGNPLSLLDVVISKTDQTVYMIERNRNIISVSNEGQINQLNLVDFSPGFLKLIDDSLQSKKEVFAISNGRQEIHRVLLDSIFVSGSAYNSAANTLLVGGTDGCYLIDAYSDSTRKYSIGRVFSAVFETENTALLAGFNGVNRLDILSGQLEPVEVIKSRVEDLLLIENEVFIATRNSGVFVKNRDSIEVINESVGLPSNTIYCLASNYKDEIWLGTRKGVVLLKRTGDGWQISSFNRQHGLLDNRVIAIDVSDSLVAVGTKKGLNIFTKEKLNREYELNLYMDSILLDTVSIEVNTSVIELTASGNSIEFFMSGICLQCGNDASYKMLINGEENDNNTGHFSLSSIAPGSYTIRFFILNAKSQFKELGQVYHLEVLKPFWERFWFIAFCGFIFVLVVIITMRRILKKRLERAKMLSDINAYQQRALTLQMKPHFIFNSMNSIQNLILKEDKREAHKYIASLAQLMRRNLEHADVDMIDLSDELEILQIYFDLEQRRLDKVIDLQMEINLTSSRENIGVPPFIFQPLLENCIWHGLNDDSIENPKIVIRINQCDNRLEVEVEDNGIGLNQAKNKKSLGTAKSGLIIQLRLELLESQYNFISNYSVKDLNQIGGNGTLVKFNLPLQNANLG